jgi:hypothetical protein
MLIATMMLRRFDAAAARRAAAFACRHFDGAAECAAAIAMDAAADADITLKLRCRCAGAAMPGMSAPAILAMLLPPCMLCRCQMRRCLSVRRFRHAERG